MKKLLMAALMGVVMMASSVDAKTLVAFFSATGNTAKVAEKLAKVVKGDLFEIKPEQVYTDADLNWRNERSRSSIEMNDKTSRPAIANKVADMSQYDTVYIGFPIWWGREPSIIDTFMESYDFAGKKVIPFVTSGSSGIGDTAENLKALAPNAQVDIGKRFTSTVSEKDLSDWVK